jgi:hypothetical protein
VGSTDNGKGDGQTDQEFHKMNLPCGNRAEFRISIWVVGLLVWEWQVRQKLDTKPSSQPQHKESLTDFSGTFKGQVFSGQSEFLVLKVMPDLLKGFIDKSLVSQNLVRRPVRSYGANPA